MVKVKNLYNNNQMLGDAISLMSVNNLVITTSALCKSSDKSELVNI